ncbi:hypothetical protein I551_4999 [Mycobacterium ulcerans str. Harvey]|uniref:Uncharacterized protein n=1 Tax=Mycobacterium ulcerans str. Harvey TaxID=1299332 RepID=A0ABN0QV07_MYCUL|nr:hypothetical protein I551_4999 [Mycobacterium ulcerans str. Harvey]
MRYDVSTQHLAVIAWIDKLPEDGDAQPLLGRVVADLARATAAQSTLVHTLGSLAVAGWVSSRLAERA